MRSYFGDWYVAFLFQMELSTPFLSLHYILDNVSVCTMLHNSNDYVTYFITGGA